MSVYAPVVKKTVFVVALSLLTVLLSAHPSSAQTSIEVHGDQSSIAYTGDGGLLLPNSFTGDASQKYAVAQCDECVWTYAIYCAQDSSDLCAHAVVTCPVGEIRYRVGFGVTFDAVNTIGSVCWGSGKPATRRDVIRDVRNQERRFLPRLRPGTNPPTSTLSTIPVIAWTRQPVSFQPPKMMLAGHLVQVKAQASWLWSWGDGTAEWHGQPGRPYPARDVTHIYSNPGTYSITVTSDWQAQFTIAGIGTFDVGGPNLHQTSVLRITVQSAHSVLVTY